MLGFPDKLFNLTPTFTFEWFIRNGLRLVGNVVLITVGSYIITWLLRQLLVPTEALFEHELDLVFDPCRDRVGMCSFLTANVSLFEEGSEFLFESGESYQIDVDIVLPESSQNRQHGMFVTVLNLLNRQNVVVDSVTRTGMLQYKSSLFRWLSVVTYFPALFFKFAQENQTLSLNYYRRYRPSAYDTLHFVHFEVRSYHIQIYSAHLRVSASLGFFRRFLFNWPITSTVLIFAIVAAILSCCSMLYWALRISTSVYRQVSIANQIQALEFRQHQQQINNETTKYNNNHNYNIPVSKTERLREEFSARAKQLSFEIEEQMKPPQPPPYESPSHNPGSRRSFGILESVFRRRLL